MEKTFRGELMKFRDLLVERTPFALARFGHAETEIVQKKLMHEGDVSGTHEWRYERRPTRPRMAATATG